MEITRKFLKDKTGARPVSFKYPGIKTGFAQGDDVFPPGLNAKMIEEGKLVILFIGSLREKAITKFAEVRKKKLPETAIN